MRRRRGKVASRRRLDLGKTWVNGYADCPRRGLSFVGRTVCVPVDTCNPAGDERVAPEFRWAVPATRPLDGALIPQRSSDERTNGI
jgi:hypothetical protein